jgi:hypothetical protein
MDTILAQFLLQAIGSILDATRAIVNRLHDALPDPPEAEDMGEGRIPESLEFSLRGDMECLVADHLDPAIELLRRAGTTTAPRKAE